MSKWQVKILLINSDTSNNDSDRTNDKNHNNWRNLEHIVIMIRLIITIIPLNALTDRILSTGPTSSTSDVHWNCDSFSIEFIEIKLLLVVDTSDSWCNSTYHIVDIETLCDQIYVNSHANDIIVWFHEQSKEIEIWNSLGWYSRTIVCVIGFRTVAFLTPMTMHLAQTEKKTSHHLSHLSLRPWNSAALEQDQFLAPFTSQRLEFLYPAVGNDK